MQASNADKTLDLGVDCGSGGLTWRLEPDIGSARNLVSALPESAALTETPLISIQNVQFTVHTIWKRETRQITCPTN